MKQLVYIETSIPSFYYEDRTDDVATTLKTWTQRWWDHSRHLYRLVTSQAVLEELNNGDYPKKEKCIALLDDLPLLAIEFEIADIVETYIRHKLMPNDLGGDALHLAIASYYKCDVLLTWNCSHLANANKFNHIRRINTLQGLFVPVLTTPFELLGEAL